MEHLRSDYKSIVKAQEWLQGCGSKITVNGRYTIGLTTAISAFQKKYGLPVTGELDEKTWKKLKAENRWWKKFRRRHCKCECHKK